MSVADFWNCVAEYHITATQLAGICGVPIEVLRNWRDSGMASDVAMNALHNYLIQEGF